MFFWVDWKDVVWESVLGGLMCLGKEKCVWLDCCVCCLCLLV